MTLRSVLIAINVVAILVILGVLGFRVLRVRHRPDEKPAQNVTPFHDDDVLETTHLENVLMWALIVSAIIAVALPLYWLREPSRQEALAAGYHDSAVERGHVLYSNKAMKTYDSTQSLLCADCHGTDASGGSAPFVITSDMQPDKDAKPVQATWKAPALNDILLRFTPDQVIQIITYGRPGTPMPAWGVAGGGPKNEQSVTDLVAYLASIQISPAKARARVADDLSKAVANAEAWVKTATDNLAAAEEALTQAQGALDQATTTAERRSARADVAAAEADVEAQKRAVENTQAYLDEVSAANDGGEVGQGRLLFEQQCARCHTSGWNTFDPTKPEIPLPGPQGGGAFGPNLTGGATLAHFPGNPASDPETKGFLDQISWVADGVEANKPYGVRGISSGRMPHFGKLLTEDQIRAIVMFERSL